ncbi:unnamed protein product [Prorocentrum cordatum]|uniref:DNA-directed RNA polymerase n=1 Tax=Prorocentrum cordatum TaxID=2364126 RepID=A0ABN9VAS0_9DINO|nr:unnamed protein product [Polarella glacialis]
MHDRHGRPSAEQLMRKIAPALEPRCVPAVRALAENCTCSCKICGRFEKPAAHPKTGGITARAVNDIVSMYSFEVKMCRCFIHFSVSKLGSIDVHPLSCEDRSQQQR